MDWRDANGVAGIHTCGPRCTRPSCIDARADELEQARAEVARLRALFVEAEKHPASSWYYTCQALGRPTILSAALAAAAPAAHPPP